MYFRDESHGWAVGQAKAFYATTDGGKRWTRVSAVDQVVSTPEHTMLNCIAFANGQADPFEHLDGPIAGVQVGDLKEG